MSIDRPGYELPQLLIAAFRALIDALHLELAERGHPDARPIHGFALRAVGPDGTTLSELGRRLRVSKQAAAKTAASLERLDYVIRERHPTDARAQLVRRTPRGEQLLSLSAEIFQQQRDALSKDLGAERIRALEDDLERIAASNSVNVAEFPGWLR